MPSTLPTELESSKHLDIAVASYTESFELFLYSTLQFLKIRSCNLCVCVCVCVCTCVRVCACVRFNTHSLRSCVRLVTSGSSIVFAFIS